METNQHNLIDRYYDLLNDITNITNDMKIWLYRNYHLVDWSNLQIVIKNNNVEDNPNKEMQEFFSPIDISLSKHFISKRNPVKDFELYLDLADMDLSVIINGKEFWWINSNDVCSLYQYAINKK